MAGTDGAANVPGSTISTVVLGQLAVAARTHVVQVALGGFGAGVRDLVAASAVSGPGRRHRGEIELDGHYSLGSSFNRNSVGFTDLTRKRDPLSSTICPT